MKGIAVLVPSVRISIGAGIVQGAGDFCRTHGYHVVLGNYEAQPEKEREYREMSGVRGVTLVLAGSSLAGLQADVVKTDNFTAAYDGTREMIGAGCRRIMFCCSTLQSPATRERLAGCREALIEAGSPLKDPVVREGNPGTPAWKRAVTALLSSGAIDGIFSANESTTIGLAGILNGMAELRDRPRIVAFDRPQYLEHADDSMTFIRQPAYEMGRVAAELLLARMRKGKHGGCGACRKVLLPASSQRAGAGHADSPQFAEVL